MFMEWIKIENYRNLVDIELHFHNDINYFVGENAVGKSNFLDLLEQMMNVRGFQESDFADVHKPIRIECKLSFSELTTSFQDMLGSEDGMYLRLEQVCCVIQSICVIAIHRKRNSIPFLHRYIWNWGKNLLPIYLRLD